MGRLIDADALKTAFTALRYGNKRRAVILDDRPVWCLSCAEVEKLIDDAPTVDAVEVVRCRDCKHGTLCRSQSGRESVECDAFDPTVILDVDSYCDMGEKQEGCGPDYCEF